MKLTAPQRKVLTEDLRNFVSAEDIAKWAKQLWEGAEKFLSIIIKQIEKSGLWDKLKKLTPSGRRTSGYQKAIMDHIHSMRAIIEKVKLIETALEQGHGSEEFLENYKSRLIGLQERVYMLREKIIDLQTDFNKGLEYDPRSYIQWDARGGGEKLPRWAESLAVNQIDILREAREQILLVENPTEAASSALAGLLHGIGGVAHGIGEVGIGIGKLGHGAGEVGLGAGELARGVGQLGLGVGQGTGDVVRGAGEAGLGVGQGAGEAARGFGSAFKNLGEGIATILSALGKRIGVVFYNDTIEKIKDVGRATAREAKNKRLNEKQQQQHAYELAKTAIENELNLEIARKKAEDRKAKLHQKPRKWFG